MIAWKELYKAVCYSIRQPRVRLGGYLFLTSIVVLIVFTLSVWLPVYNEYKTSWATYNSQKNEILQISHKNKLIESYRTNSQRIDAVEQKLGKNTAQAEIIKEINQIAKAYRVNVVTESYKQGEIVNSYISLSHDLAIEGEYSSILKFLKNISNLSSWTMIQRVSLKKSANKVREIKAILKLVTYSEVGAS